MRDDVPNDEEGNTALPDGRIGRAIRDPRDPALGYITMMCSMAAYTAELCLKRIACITRDDKKALKIHDLAALYEDLPWKTRQRLEDDFASTITMIRKNRSTGRVTTSAPEPLKEICSRHADVFPVARYMTEGKRFVHGDGCSRVRGHPRHGGVPRAVDHRKGGLSETKPPGSRQDAEDHHSRQESIRLTVEYLN